MAKVIDPETGMVFDDPAHAWNQAMNLIRAYVRSLDNLDDYEIYTGTYGTAVVMNGGKAAADRMEFADVLEAAIVERATEEGVSA